MNRDLENAYLAGLFDGEGSVGIYKTGPQKKNYQLTIQVSNTNLKSLNYFKSFYNKGCVVKLKIRSSKHKQAYIWKAVSRDALSILLEMLPFLRIKKELALQGTSIYEMDKKGSTRLTQSERVEYVRMYILELNKHGII